MSPATVREGWRGSPTGKPAHTGMPMPERHRLKIVIAARKRSIEILDRHYINRRGQLLRELGEYQARVAEIDGGS